MFRTKIYLIAVFSILVTGFTTQSLLSAQVKGNKAKRQIEEGSDLFANYCASCHGTDARGSGPVTPALRVVPPDLTRIEKKDGKFPAEDLSATIAGTSSIPVHGTREMPVWGSVLTGKEIISIVKYLESIQRQF